MRATVFSTRSFEREPLMAAGRAGGHELALREERLDRLTARLAEGCRAVCLFVGDSGDRQTLAVLAEVGVRLLALRSAGFNHIDLDAAEELGLTVARVPAYSPHAVAEHAAALLLTLNRKTHRAYNRVREQNFALDGLMGFDLFGKTVGVVGTGKIGECFARIMLGFGCRVLGSDPSPSENLRSAGVEYADLPRLWESCDIVSLHCPLTPATRHLVDARALAAMKPGVVLLNTCRGAVVDTRAVIAALKSGHLGALGIDVYEEEGDIFFRDLSSEIIQDDVFVRLLTFPNVLITGHQGFLTREAVRNIADTTVANLTDFERGAIDPENLVEVARHVAPAPPPGTEPEASTPAKGAT